MPTLEEYELSIGLGKAALETVEDLIRLTNDPRSFMDLRQLIDHKYNILYNLHMTQELYFKQKKVVEELENTYRSD